jgi:S-adenosylmethionine:tRNA ribosyltransferase-isomerase
MTRSLRPEFELSTYRYLLDKARIAQRPAERRDASRLEVVHRLPGKDGSPLGVRLEHRPFVDIVQYLSPGDLLVLNDTRVMPARLTGEKILTGREVQLLLLRAHAPDPTLKRWEALARGTFSPGNRVAVGEELEIEFLERFGDGRWLVSLEHEGDLFELLDRVGHTPLPPYIGRPDEPSDRERYQTVYARSPESMRKSGASVAAPTAGLHFTPEVLDKVRAQGAGAVFLTLHIGPGTFRPVRSADIRRHRMDPEYFEIPAETARRVRLARESGGRIIAVGTSATRALESAAGPDGRLVSSGTTELFVHPGYRFRMVDGLLTNFHMPESTLFMLVSAMTGIANLKKAYAEAAEMGYRFLSFGDAMLIL